MNIPIRDDELVPDAALAALWNCTRRTLARYEDEPDGLPFVLLGGKKYRPLKQCQSWLTKRVKQRNPSRAA